MWNTPEETNPNWDKMKKEAMDYSRGRLANKTWVNFKGVEMHYGVPDRGIGKYLIKINSNPLVVTVSSHSGMPDRWIRNHALGNPYVWVKFKTPSAKQYYLDKLKEAGFVIHQVMGNDGISYDIEASNGKISQPEVVSFWNKVTKILSSKMPSKKSPQDSSSTYGNLVWW